MKFRSQSHLTYNSRFVFEPLVLCQSMFVETPMSFSFRTNLENLLFSTISMFVEIQVSISTSTNLKTLSFRNLPTVWSFLCEVSRKSPTIVSAPLHEDCKVESSTNFVKWNAVPGKHEVGLWSQIEPILPE